MSVSNGLQGLVNVATFIADIYQELPNSCVFVMNSEGEQQGKNNFDLISHEERGSG
jgi:hypothetical protein